jgi:uncharacterized protein YwgA
MKNSKNGSALNGHLNKGIRNWEQEETDLDGTWLQLKTTWADMERRLEASERERKAQTTGKVRLDASCAMRQLRKIIQKVRDTKYFFTKEKVA